MASGRLGPDVAFEVSLLDESYQIERWGEDPEAAKRRDGMGERPMIEVYQVPLGSRRRFLRPRSSVLLCFCAPELKAKNKHT